MRSSLSLVCGVVAALSLACSDSSKSGDEPASDMVMDTSPQMEEPDASDDNSTVEMGNPAAPDAGTMMGPDASTAMPMPDAGMQPPKPDAGMMQPDAAVPPPVADFIDVGSGPKAVDASKTRCGYESLVEQYLFRAVAGDLTVGVGFDETPAAGDYTVVDYYKAPYGPKEVGAVTRASGTDYDSIGGGKVTYQSGTTLVIKLSNVLVKSSKTGATRTVSAQFSCPAGTSFRPSLRPVFQDSETARSDARDVLLNAD